MATKPEDPIQCLWCGGYCIDGIEGCCRECWEKNQFPEETADMFEKRKLREKEILEESTNSMKEMYKLKLSECPKCNDSPDVNCHDIKRESTLTPKNMIDLKKQLVLLLCNYQQELYDRFRNETEFTIKDRSILTNYGWRTPELWEKYASVIVNAVSEQVRINNNHPKPKGE